MSHSTDTYMWQYHLGLTDLTTGISDDYLVYVMSRLKGGSKSIAFTKWLQKDAGHLSVHGTRPVTYIKDADPSRDSRLSGPQTTLSSKAPQLGGVQFAQSPMDPYHARSFIWTKDERSSPHAKAFHPLSQAVGTAINVEKARSNLKSVAQSSDPLASPRRVVDRPASPRCTASFSVFSGSPGRGEPSDEELNEGADDPELWQAREPLYKPMLMSTVFSTYSKCPLGTRLRACFAIEIDKGAEKWFKWSGSPQNRVDWKDGEAKQQMERRLQILTSVAEAGVGTPKILRLSELKEAEKERAAEDEWTGKEQSGTLLERWQHEDEELQQNQSNSAADPDLVIAFAAWFVKTEDKDEGESGDGDETQPESNSDWTAVPGDWLRNVFRSDTVEDKLNSALKCEATGNVLDVWLKMDLRFIQPGTHSAASIGGDVMLDGTQIGWARVLLDELKKDAEGKGDEDPHEMRCSCRRGVFFFSPNNQRLTHAACFKVLMKQYLCFEAEDTKKEKQKQQRTFQHRMGRFSCIVLALWRVFKAVFWLGLLFGAPSQNQSPHPKFSRIDPVRFCRQVCTCRSSSCRPRSYSITCARCISRDLDRSSVVWYLGYRGCSFYAEPADGIQLDRTGLFSFCSSLSGPRQSTHWCLATPHAKAQFARHLALPRLISMRCLPSLSSSLVPCSRVTSASWI